MDWIAKVEEIRSLLEADNEVRRSYDDFEESWWEMDHLLNKMSEWVHEQFRNGSLEKKLESFKSKDSERNKARISKALIANFVDPSTAGIVRESGELPSLSVGEREAMQFLLWKIDNMTEVEMHIKTEFILDGVKERPKESGYVVVFERTQALKKSYGEDICFSGKHFNTL